MCSVYVKNVSKCVYEHEYEYAKVCVYECEFVYEGTGVCVSRTHEAVTVIK